MSFLNKVISFTATRSISRLLTMPAAHKRSIRLFPNFFILGRQSHNDETKPSCVKHADSNPCPATTNQYAYRTGSLTSAKQQRLRRRKPRCTIRATLPVTTSECCPSEQQAFLLPVKRHHVIPREGDERKLHENEISPES
jgi:hypothetical protein